MPRDDSTDSAGAFRPVPATYPAGARTMSVLKISQEGRNKQRPPKVLSPRRRARLRATPNLLIALSRKNRQNEFMTVVQRVNRHQEYQRTVAQASFRKKVYRSIDELQPTSTCRSENTMNKGRIRDAGALAPACRRIGLRACDTRQSRQRRSAVARCRNRRRGRFMAFSPPAGTVKTEPFPSSQETLPDDCGARVTS